MSGLRQGIEGAVDHSTSNLTKLWQMLACGLELHHEGLTHQLLLADADARDRGEPGDAISRADLRTARRETL